ncbi:hypothetical protein PROFUN_15835 [Planoprotostelium fungivorum]|uniref:Uncharacterized protein n=1 Tax=Planoprotostelium fungivorum TaxID=1890364 RepID=A0A2P6MU86_9EUKA|nr:hypothetical protein PROFUN_15835 [Planoprotostelium fungivorum]
MKTFLLLLLVAASLALNTPVSLGSFFTSPLSMSSDGSIICGVQNGSLLIFFEEKTVQSIPNITTAVLSGDAQWLIAYDGNVTLFTYARKRDTVISWILTGTIELFVKSQYIPQILVDSSASRFAFFDRNDRSNTVCYLYSRDSNSNVFSLAWNFISSGISPDLNIAFNLIASGVNVTKLDWTLKQQIPSNFISVPISIEESSIAAISNDGSSFVVDGLKPLLFRNSTLGWIQSSLLVGLQGAQRVSYAISGDGTFLFENSGGKTRRYLLTNLTSSYLPHDIAYEGSSVLMTSNMNGSRIIFNHGYYIYDRISAGLVVDIAGPRYPARGVCQDDTWCQAGLTCGPAHYCYVPGTKSKPDNFTVTATRYRVVIQYVEPSAVDCIDAGSRPIQEQLVLNVPTPDNTNVTVAIFDNNSSIQFIQGGLLLSDDSTTKTFDIKLNDTQSRVQVWLTSVCVDAAASSEMEVIMFNHLTDPTTSQDQTKNTIISSTYNSASVMGVGCAVTLMAMAFLL